MLFESTISCTICTDSYEFLNHCLVPWGCVEKRAGKWASDPSWHLFVRIFGKKLWRIQRMIIRVLFYKNNQIFTKIHGSRTQPRDCVRFRRGCPILHIKYSVMNKVIDIPLSDSVQNLKEKKTSAEEKSNHCMINNFAKVLLRRTVLSKANTSYSANNTRIAFVC